MNAQASLSIDRMPNVARWGLWLTSCVIGQGLGYFIFVLAKLGELDHVAWLFASFWGLVAVMSAPAIFVPTLAWHVLRLGSGRVPVSLLQGVIFAVLAIIAGIIAQFILVRMLSGFA